MRAPSRSQPRRCCRSATSARSWSPSRREARRSRTTPPINTKVAKAKPPKPAPTQVDAPRRAERQASAPSTYMAMVRPSLDPSRYASKRRKPEAAAAGSTDKAVPADPEPRPGFAATDELMPVAEAARAAGAGQWRRGAQWRWRTDPLGRGQPGQGRADVPSRSWSRKRTSPRRRARPPSWKSSVRRHPGQRSSSREAGRCRRKAKSEARAGSGQDRSPRQSLFRATGKRRPRRPDGGRV